MNRYKNVLKRLAALSKAVSVVKIKVMNSWDKWIIPLLLILAMIFITGLFLYTCMAMIDIAAPR